MTQEIFLCGSPGGNNGRDVNHHLFQMLVDDSHPPSTNHRRNGGKLRTGCLLDEEEKDSVTPAQMDGSDGGIEVDTEGSLRPAYELYRV